MTVCDFCGCECTHIVAVTVESGDRRTPPLKEDYVKAFDCCTGCRANVADTFRKTIQAAKKVLTKGTPKDAPERPAAAGLDDVLAATAG